MAEAHQHPRIRGAVRGTRPQQYEAATLGMWTFLATEVLFFGGLFMAYIIYRHAYPDGFAEGSRHTNRPPAPSTPPFS